MKKEQNQLKEAFVAFREIQNKLDQGILRTFNLDKKEITIKIQGLWVAEDDGEWFIAYDDYELLGHCELSKWIERNFTFDIYSHIDYPDYKNDLKIFKNDLNKLEKLYPAKSDHAEEFVTCYFESTRNSKKNTSIDTLFKKFEKQYSELVASKIQHQEVKKQKERSQTNPEEFVSINGVLVSKEEIKKLAASL